MTRRLPVLALAVLGPLLAAPARGDAPAAPATPAAAPTAKTPLREIGHARAETAFCRAFFRHFNGTVRPTLANDGQLGAIGFTYGTLESHFDGRAGELKIYDDRVHLGSYVDAMMKQLTEAQGELDELRRTAALSTDTAQQRDTKELAAQLQRALDKQKQMAYDSQHVVQAMMDLDLGTNSQFAGKSLPKALGLTSEEGSPRASTSYQTNVPGGYNPNEQTMPASERDVRSYLHWQDQLDRIGDAESSAAELADTIASGC